mmetsp:Transcript_49282/g.88541  ORF Transcript_49282/g.88541 Transcript_49282/m.88541 type:complete len:238 (+) Transcript_49282:329-1042(+)
MVLLRSQLSAKPLPVQLTASMVTGLPGQNAIHSAMALQLEAGQSSRSLTMGACLACLRMRSNPAVTLASTASGIHGHHGLHAASHVAAAFRTGRGTSNRRPKDKERIALEMQSRARPAMRRSALWTARLMTGVIGRHASPTALGRIRASDQSLDSRQKLESCARISLTFGTAKTGAWIVRFQTGVLGRIAAKPAGLAQRTGPEAKSTLCARLSLISRSTPLCLSRGRRTGASRRSLT